MQRIATGPWLVVDWSQHGVSIIDAEVSDDRVVVRRHVTWNGPDGSGSDQSDLSIPTGSTEWLRQQVREAGWQGRRALVVLPRRQSTFKLLDLPAVSPQELAGLVRLQAEGRFSSDMSDYVVDFAAQPRQPGGERLVLVAACSKRMVETARTTLNTAGLKLSGMTLAELSSPAIDVEDRSIPHLVIWLSESRAELTLFRNDLPLATMTQAMDPASPEACRVLNGAIERLWAGLPEMARPLPLKTVSVAGPRAHVVATALSSLRTGTVTAISDADGVPPEATRLVAAVSYARRHGIAVNWLDPRQPPDPRQVLLRRGLLIATAALVPLAWGWAVIDRQARSLNREVQHLQQEIRSFSALVEKGEATLEADRRLEEWERRGTNWSDAIGGLLQRLPETDALVLSRVHAEAGDEAPILRLRGRARDAAVVTSIHENLIANSGGYRFRPGPIESRTDDTSHPVPFSLEAFPEVESTSSSDEPVDSTEGASEIP